MCFFTLSIAVIISSLLVTFHVSVSTRTTFVQFQWFSSTKFNRRFDLTFVLQNSYHSTQSQFNFLFTSTAEHLTYYTNHQTIWRAFFSVFSIRFICNILLVNVCTVCTYTTSIPLVHKSNKHSSCSPFFYFFVQPQRASSLI